MERTVNIAVVGATGLVGEAILEILAQREFPSGQLFLLAGDDSAGKSLQFKGQTLRVGRLQDFDFSQVEIAFFATDAEVSVQYAPAAADAGCVVIDNSSGFRYDPDVPLVIPEVNSEMVGEYRNQGIIASPGSTTIQMLMVLAPVYREVGIERINISTYQAVSGSGRKGVEEIAGQTARLLNGLPVETDVFAKQ
ncbi:MAG: aspartate-semialdehyde dehydrogenase, partial [Pontibacterium sp.]